MKKESIELLDELIERYPVLAPERQNILDTFLCLVNCYSHGGKLLIAGNGGSAADAEHITGELMKGFVKKRPLDVEFGQKLQDVEEELGKELSAKLQKALPAIAVVDHVALSTAFLNDVDPLLGVAQQVNGYGNENDVFLGISTSGNSRNILYACVVAKAKGLKVVGLTGGNGGKLIELSDVSIVVPEMATYKIQELHLPIYHTLCLMLEANFFEE